MSYFAALGVDPKFGLDADDLKKKFYALSRQWHPDKFSLASAPEQQKALDTTALLNDAFRVLRDPTARAEYFLELQQIQPAKSPPPELLEEVFELNMALEELRDGDQTARPQLEQAKQRFSKMLAEVDENVDALGAEYDQQKDNDLLLKIRGLLDRRQYVSNLLRDVNKAL
jgi:molecular chaperone HscB